jgi:hypothetical protein
VPQRDLPISSEPVASSFTVIMRCPRLLSVRTDATRHTLLDCGLLQHDDTSLLVVWLSGDNWYCSPRTKQWVYNANTERDVGGRLWGRAVRLAVGGCTCSKR